jgi:hypothetical protein
VIDATIDAGAIVMLLAARIEEKSPFASIEDKLPAAMAELKLAAAAVGIIEEKLPPAARTEVIAAI